MKSYPIQNEYNFVEQTSVSMLRLEPNLIYRYSFAKENSRKSRNLVLCKALPVKNTFTKQRSRTLESALCRKAIAETAGHFGNENELKES